jgi:hypothetical protein
VNIVLASSSKCALLAQRSYGSLTLLMHQEDLWHRTPIGRVVRIGRSSRNHSLWAIFLDGRLVCDTFSSPEEAAECAYKHDFPDEAAVELFRGVSVPYDLARWRRSPPGPWTPGAGGCKN